MAGPEEEQLGEPHGDNGQLALEDGVVSEEEPPKADGEDICICKFLPPPSHNMHFDSS